MKRKHTINRNHFVVKDIQDISKFNFYPAVGITAG
jgi:hypothetical protein